MIEAIELTSTRRSRGAGGGPVQKVSFDVYPGQVTALLGAPGAGKSTVLRLMAELEPGTGRTLFGGRPYRALRPAVREVGLALNPEALHPGRTVQAHLQLYAAAGGVPKARVAEVLEVAGLSTQATVRCGRLDPGQRQRLAIAAALIGDPAALILDEPHALDTHGMSWFHALIRAYAAQGRTVLVAATDPDTLSGTADHVVVLRRDEQDGISRVIASRSAAEVFDERRATVVQVRSPQAARLAATLETEGARLAPAGPGALQVRGLDRARIGELAHVAGICLHELSEIGHDDDVFGLRPVPRRKELLPGLNRADTIWHSGVRVVADQIEEAEVVEVPEEVPATAGVGAQATAAVASGEAEQQVVQGAGAASVHAESLAGEAEQRVASGGGAAAGAGMWPSQGSVAEPREAMARDDAAPSQSSMVGAGPATSQADSEAMTSAHAQNPASPEQQPQRPAGMAGQQVAAPISDGMQPPRRLDGVAEQHVAAQASDGMQPPRSSVEQQAQAGGTAPISDGVQTSQSLVTEAERQALADAAVPTGAGVQPVEQSSAAPTDVVAASVGSRASGATPSVAGSWRTQGSVAWTTAKVHRVTPPPLVQVPPLQDSAPAAVVVPPAPVEPQRRAPAASKRRTSAFGLRWGRSKQSPASAAPEPPANAITTSISAATTPITTPITTLVSAATTSASTPVADSVATAAQPAVPFTVAAGGEPDVGADGMTPWRAVASRASQQGSVAEAAPAEQEASA